MYKCLKRWRIESQWLIGFLTVPVDVYNWLSHWSSPLNFYHCLKRELSGGIHDSRSASIRKALIPFVSIYANEWMTRNLSLELGKLTDSIAKAIWTQQQSLDSLVKVILDNCIALYYLLAEQGGICTIANTACGYGEISLEKQKSNYVKLGNKYIDYNKFHLMIHAPLIFFSYFKFWASALGLLCKPQSLFCSSSYFV